MPVILQKQSDTAFLDRLEAEGIHTREAMRFMGNDEQQYVEILRLFVSDSKEKEQKLGEFFRTENWKEYGVLVHALKSNMRSLGADELADMAFALEKAAKASDSAFVKENHDAFVLEWNLLLTGLKYIPRLGIVSSLLAQMQEAGDSGETLQDAVSEWPKEEYAERTAQIAALLDDFELELAKKGLKELQSKVLSAQQKKQLTDAENAMKDYDYEKVIAILSE